MMLYPSHGTLWGCQFLEANASTGHPQRSSSARIATLVATGEVWGTDAVWIFSPMVIDIQNDIHDVC